MSVQYKTTLLFTEKPHVLVVDDDERLRDLLKRYLTGQGFIVITACDAGNALEKLKRFSFDISILDVMMPKEDGISLAKKMRKIYPDLPVVLLTALGESESRIQGLEAGVDDYIAKPFEPKELMLRLKAILRRTMGIKKSAIEGDILLGEYSYNIEREELQTLENKAHIPLTEKEKHLLKCFVKRVGQVVSREELANLNDISGSDRAIDVQVTRLRRKIELDPKNPRYLHTIRGKGYVLRPDSLK